MASSLYCSTGSGGQWPGAIVGDLPNPLGGILLSPGQLYTTGDLDLGGDGEVGSLSAFTVEFWFRAQALPASLEAIIGGPITPTGFRQWLFTLDSSGTINFTVRNSTPASVSVAGPAIQPTGSPAHNYQLWYHIVGRLDGTTIKIYFNGAEVGSTGWSGQVENLGTTPGSMDTFIGTSLTTQTYYFDEVAIYRTSLGADRILAHHQAGAQRGFVNGLMPGQHVIAALDVSGSVAPRRINLGSRAMWPSFYAASSALDEVQNARLAENVDATAFIAKDGTVVFLDAAHRSTAPYNTVQMTVGDAGGAEIPYEDLGVDYSEETLANEWNVTGISAGANGTTQTRSDATSIARYFRRPQSITGVPVTDADCANIAAAMLAKYKDPILRGTNVAFDVNDPDTADKVFDRDLADRIRMLRTPPGGGARIDQNLFVQQIEISGDNSGAPWDVSWGVSPL